VEVVSLLLDGGADVNQATMGNSGAAPLYVAAENGHVKVVGRRKSSQD
jgi:hypothetical protein